MPTAKALAIETWVEYAIASLTMAMRYFTRFKLSGRRGFGWDDVFMGIAWVFYTVMCAMAYLVPIYETNAFLSDFQRANMSPTEEARRITGSKFFVVGHNTYVTVKWSVKVAMIFFISRITQGLTAGKLIKPALVVVGVTWLAEILTIEVGCIPFSANWQINPNPGGMCTHESPIIYIVQIMFDVLTDIGIMAIPMPVITRANISLGRKLGLYVLLGAGVFVIIASILRVYFAINTKDAIAPAIWASRETLVSILISNAPVIRPFFRRKLWTGGYAHTSGSASHPGGGPSRSTAPHHASGSRKHMGVSVALSSKSDGRSARRGSVADTPSAAAQVSKGAGIRVDERGRAETASMEHIVTGAGELGDESGSASEDDAREGVRFPHGEIRVLQTYEVDSRADDGYAGGQGLGGKGWVG